MSQMSVTESKTEGFTSLQHLRTFLPMINGPAVSQLSLLLNMTSFAEFFISTTTTAVGIFSTSTFKHLTISHSATLLAPHAVATRTIHLHSPGGK